MKLGIFDSGVGGEAVAEALKLTFPTAEILTASDKPNVPYGSKTPDKVRSLTNAAIQPLLAAHCDVIILACNTATTHAIQYLRELYPSQRFIGIEPMVKPASQHTKTGTIAICATPATLASERYAELKTTYATNLTVLEPDCSDWAYRIEHNSLNETAIRQVIIPLLDQGADTIVLGCTHYHWIKETIQEIAADKAVILEPSEAIGRRVQQLLRLG